MSPWWGNSSCKGVKKKTKRESIFDILQRKLKNVSEEKGNIEPGESKKHQSDTITKKGSRSFGPSTRSPSPSAHVSRCLSFAEGHYAHPLPLPGSPFPTVSDANAGTILTLKLERATEYPTSKQSPDFHRPSVSSESSIVSPNSSESQLVSPLASDCEIGNGATTNNSFSVVHKDHLSIIIERNSRASSKPVPSLRHNSKGLSSSPKGVPLHLQISGPGGLCSAPDSSMSSPSRSPMRAFGSEQVLNSGICTAKLYPDIASGHCFSPGSGHNSVGGDLLGQVFRTHNKCSTDCSPIPSPRMTSPGPSSRIQSGAVTPLHPLAGGAAPELPIKRSDVIKQQSHRLPLPPLTIPKSCPLSPTYSASATPSTPRSPARAENATSPGSRWTKGQLLGRGTFGHVYIGFDRESGEMCAMKEVTLFADDPRSRESAKQLGQEIALLSQLRHPNIVQYYGSETVDDRLYIYLEYVSGGSIYKLVQEYGQLGELAIRNYTRQILSGLAYLHAKNTVHRDIKGANILVDPNGQIKLADFGMAKHITGHSCPFSCKGSPYWMAPEVIKNSSGCNIAVDIWSLGCTVLEMATAKPPWSQYEGVAAMFKIGNSKELPTIPDHLSKEGKDFVRLCLQRNPVTRPSAAQLLEHPFVKISLLERRILTGDPSETPLAIIKAARSLAIGPAKHNAYLDFEVAGIYPSRSFRACSGSREAHTPRNISCPVSPSGSLILPSKSLHKSGRKSPSPASSPHTASGSSTPQTCGGGGGGAVPVRQPKQLALSHEAVSMIHSSRSLHKNGRMSPSPTSSPHTASGSSTPRTCDCGAVRAHQSKQQTFSHEAAGMINSSKSLHKSGRTSPSPTSSPHTASGLSTPQTRGSGPVRVHQSKQPTFSHEVASMINSPKSFHKSGRMSPSPTSSTHTASGSSTWQTRDGGAVQFHHPKPQTFSKHNQFRIDRQGRHACPDKISSDNDDTLANCDRMAVDGKSHLADCVLTRDYLQSNQSLPHRPGTRRLGRMDG